MTIFQPDYQIAVGHNNAGGLATLEGITPSGDIYAFQPFQVYPNYSAGEFAIRADGLLYVRGYPFQEWRFALMSWVQFRYLQTTYCNGGYAGEVTIRTRLEDPTTYANYNAVMRLPQLINQRRISSAKSLNDVIVTHTRIVAI